MNTITPLTTSDIRMDLLQIPGVIFCGWIQRSLTDNTIIGCNIAATALVRKHAHTAEMMAAWCQERGFTLVDDQPYTTAMKIIF